jgi:hypothetical protein
VHLSAEELANITAGTGATCPGTSLTGIGWRAHRPRPTPAGGSGWRPGGWSWGSRPRCCWCRCSGTRTATAGSRSGPTGRWQLHVGDAYYLRAELGLDDHPVSALGAARADDNARRVESLNHLRRLARDHADAVTLFGYHDFGEFPPAP